MDHDEGRRHRPQTRCRPDTVESRTHRVSGRSHGPPDRCVGGACSYHEGGEIEWIFDRRQRVILRQSLRRAPLIEVCRKRFPARISSRICDIDTSPGELVVNRPPLFPRTDQGHLTTPDGNEPVGGFDNPLIVPFSKHDPTTNGRSSGFEPFKKIHSSSPAAIVTQEPSPQSGRNARSKELCELSQRLEQPCTSRLTSRSSWETPPWCD